MYNNTHYHSINTVAYRYSELFILVLPTSFLYYSQPSLGFFVVFYSGGFMFTLFNVRWRLSHALFSLFIKSIRRKEHVINYRAEKRVTEKAG